MIKLDYKRAFFNKVWFGHWWCTRCATHFLYVTNCRSCSSGYWQKVCTAPWPIIKTIPIFKEQEIGAEHHEFHMWLAENDW